MRARRRHLVGLSLAALLTLSATPAAAPAATSDHASETSRVAYSKPEAPRSPACSRFFCVHWVAEGLDAPDPTDADGDGIPDYVGTVLEVAEHVHEVENEQLGWREPVSDGTIGGGRGKTDVYLLQVSPEIFGYASPDRGQFRKEGPGPRRLHAFLVLDNDYSAFEFPGTDPLQDLQATIAHEYNHILQFGYDAFQDSWFAEATAVWMEDQVYDGIDDYLRYVGHWVNRFETPLTTSSTKEYGSAVWNQWLAERYGPALIRKAWAEAAAVRPAGFSAGVYDAAIRAAGPSSFSRDFTRFAAAVAEWRTGEGFAESHRFADMPRQGELKLGAAAEIHRLNHTTFEPLHVLARGGRAVVANASAPPGVAAGLALVGRIGSERRGTTVTQIDFSRRGKLRVSLDDPGRFSRITAVLVNADSRIDGFSPRRLDWRYLSDQVPLAIRGKLVRY